MFIAVRGVQLVVARVRIENLQVIRGHDKVHPVAGAIDVAVPSGMATVLQGPAPKSIPGPQANTVAQPAVKAWMATKRSPLTLKPCPASSDGMMKYPSVRS